MTTLHNNNTSIRKYNNHTLIEKQYIITTHFNNTLITE